MKNTLRCLGRLASFALALSAAFPARGQGPTPGPSFEGSAQVPAQEDAARARSRALADAMNQALEQAVAQAAPEVRGRLYLLSARARDYITTYRVLEEGETGGQFLLRLQAEVDLPRLLRDLQGTVPAVRQAGPRRAGLLVCSTTASPAAETLVEQTRGLLSERGESIERLTAAQCSPTLAQSAASGASKSPVHALLMLTLDDNLQAEEVRGTQPRRFGALGHATWRAHQLGESNAPSQAALSETAEAAGFGETAEAAAQTAQQTASGNALEKLLKRPGVLPYSGSSVLVSILGAGGYANYQQLLRVLAALPGVSQAEPRRFLPATGAGAGQTDDLMQVLLHTASSPQTLGAALARTPLSGLSLQVAPQGPAELRVVCAPGSALPAEGPVELPPPPPIPEGSEAGTPSPPRPGP
jgi:hypothetical protein